MDKMTPIARAVAPLEAVAVEHAEMHAKNVVERVLADLAAADWDVEAAAPYPSSWNMGRREYMEKKGKYDLYRAFVSTDPVRGKISRSTRDPNYVVANQDRINRFIDNNKEMAAAQYKAFVAKLEGKVGDHANAELLGSSVWHYSIIRVTKNDGSTENWKTQMIWKTSCLGKLHNQWPTRKVK